MEFIIKNTEGDRNITNEDDESYNISVISPRKFKLRSKYKF